MKHNRFAEEIFHESLCTRGGDICPVPKFALLDGFALMCDIGISLLLLISIYSLCSQYPLHSGSNRGRIGGAGGIIYS